MGDLRVGGDGMMDSNHNKPLPKEPGPSGVGGGGGGPGGNGGDSRGPSRLSKEITAGGGNDKSGGGATTATKPETKHRTGLGRQFGRLGGAVAGRGKRNP